jgi:pimeloyl-ACP methyl ester carboxylesterase
MHAPSFPAPTLRRLPDRAGQPAITLAVHEQGAGPAVVFCHGFPELAYSWRHQLPAVAAAGFRAIAPDQRGYGGSTRPERIEDYGLTELTGDLVGLLDALGVERAVFVGHDWGGLVAWAMPVLHPARTAGVAGVCTPYLGLPTIAVIKSLVGGVDERHYMAWFQAPGVAEAVLDGQVHIVFEKLMRSGVPLAEVLPRLLVDGVLDVNPFRRIAELEPFGELIVGPAELATYVAAFERTGFRGGINWYRNIDRNAREHPAIGTERLTLPCLMLAAERDPFLRPELAEPMRTLCADLELHALAGAGHWAQQECPEVVNRHLVDWLTRRMRAA